MNSTQKKFCWINTLLTAILLFVFWLILNGISRYSTLQRNIFIGINVAYLVFSLVLLVITIKVNNTTKNYIRTSYIAVLLVLVGVSTYAYSLIGTVNSTINNIVSQDHKINYQAAFVVRKNTFKNVDEFENKTIGIIQSENFIEGNVLPLDELEKLKFENVKKKQYESYPLLINALLQDEVDFISLPAAYEDLYVTDDQISENLDKIETVHEFENYYDNTSIISGSDINVTEVPFTMLIMGNDGGRTDSLMLASVNPSSMQITLTSIARDSYVPISCYPNQGRDKINHARQISRECTIRTVENLLDISVDFYVEISFQGLLDIVDALGTIPIDSPVGFPGNIEREGGGGVFVPEGLNDLNGDQVLAFVRERSSFVNGDFQRQLNQQQAISSLITTIAQTRDVNTLLNVIKATGDNVETNLSVSQIVDLMNLAIVRMESTYLGPADIVTIYGSRLTGQGVMNYAPDYGFELYYYIPFNQSIEDNQKLISMNMRSDGILEIPEGFNYSASDEYVAPSFSTDYYTEDVDPSVFRPNRAPVPDNREPENEKPNGESPGQNGDKKDEQKNDEVILIELYGKTLSEANAYLSKHGFTSNVVQETEVITDDKNLDGKIIVRSKTVGIPMDKERSVINFKVDVYKYVESTPIPEEKPPKDSDNNTDEIEEENNNQNDSNENVEKP